MDKTPRCHSCGVALPGQAVEGMCANCLLKLALEAPLTTPGNLEDAATSQATSPNPVVSVVSSTDLSGTTIGRYKLRQKIGEGGMGAVYLAEQREPVMRKVALKIIKAGMDTQSVVARFEAERQALAMMDHPNIAKVFDGGTTGSAGSEISNSKVQIIGGRPYFVMELVRGVKMTDYCNQTQLSVPERLKLFIQVCQAIQHAHQKGIIHRDIKPSNIIVAVNDGVPVPKVIDFGIAKATDQRLTENSYFTEFHAFLGTPAYTSPEQAELSSLDIDTRSDIYSLGVLLYELLTGVTPFDTKELLASGIDAMRKTIREKEPVRPSTRLTQLNSASAGRKLVPRPSPLASDLDWIVMKCLEKDRARRYETANGLAADLGRHLANEPVVARPPSASYLLQKAWRRNRLVLTAGGAVVVILLVGAAVSIWQATRAITARQAEHEQRTRAEANETRALASEEAARRAERETRQRLYAADMVAAQHALAEGNLGQARDYLRNHIPEAGQPDLRGFEWRYYWDQTEGRQAHTFTGHSNLVYCVAFSPDGRWLISGGWDSQVFLWDVRERKRVTNFVPGGGEVRSVAVTPDGDLLAVGTQSEVSLWRMNDVRQPSLVIRRPAKEARVNFVPHTSQLAIGLVQSVWGYGFEPGSVELWDYEANQTIREFPETGSRTALPAAGGILFTGVRHNLLQRWDLISDRPPLTAEFPWPLRSLACSPDGRWLITTSGEEDNRAQLWDGVRLSPIRTLIRHPEKTDIWSVAFSRDNQFAATAHADQLIRLWSLEATSDPVILRGHGSEVRAVCFAPDGRLLATGGADETVRLWDLGTASQPTAIRNVDHDQWQQGPTLSPDGRLMAIGGEGATIELWDLEWLRRVGVLTNASHAIRFSADSAKLITLDDTVTLKVWDLARRAPESVVTLANVAHYYRGFALSPDGQFLVGASREGDDTSTITLWNVATGEKATRAQAHHRALWAVVFFPDGRRFATCGEDRVARIWNAQTLEREAEFGGHKDQVFGVGLSSDGTLLATASIDGTAKVWNVAERRELWTLKGHKRGVLDIVFNTDGKTLATCSDDGSVRVWNLATGREVGSWQFGRQTCWAVFSPDGSRLVVVDNSGTATVLNGPLSSLQAR
ncbi:MAG TPA: hypothetical protein DCE44_26460 [Verrucomicrobiales bacterium]|nr:hypothetical protein [Verrucomicrobiales bacterium]